jgi:hypothetical protein
VNGPHFSAINWLLRSVVSERDLEPLLGDLEEEYGLLRASRPPAEVARWYCGQVCRSLAPLAWATMRQRGWPITFGLAIVLFVVWGAIETLVTGALSTLISPDTPSFVVSMFAVGLAVALCSGYVAARLRDGTPLVLAILAFVTIAALMVTTAGTEGWYGVAWLIVGPLAVLAGGALRRRTRSSSALTSS